jgi:hypothetical protein
VIFLSLNCSDRIFGAPRRRRSGFALERLCLALVDVRFRALIPDSGQAAIGQIEPPDERPVFWFRWRRADRRQSAQPRRSRPPNEMSDLRRLRSVEGGNFDRRPGIWGTPGADSADKARGSVLDLPASLYSRCRRGPLSLTIGVVFAGLAAIARIPPPATHPLLGPTVGLADHAGPPRDLARHLPPAFLAKLHLAIAWRWNDRDAIAWRFGFPPGFERRPRTGRDRPAGDIDTRQVAMFHWSHDATGEYARP